MRGLSDRAAHHCSDIEPSEAVSDPSLPGDKFRLGLIWLGNGPDREGEDDQERDSCHDGVEGEFCPLEVLERNQSWEH